MLQNDDEVRLEDTMSSNMMLNSDSLKVIDVANNQEIDVKSSLIINENTFSFEVPDDRALTITYTAYVSGELYEDVDVSNSISYYGTGVTNSSTKETHIEIASSASISATLYFYIKKINGVDMSSALSGAQYKLYTVYKTTGELSESPIATQTSDSDGKIKFDNLEESTVYAFKESQAPEKYYIDEENAEPSYVAFKHSAVTQAMKDKGLNVTIIQKGATFQRYNYKGEITVTKSFEGTEIADGLYYFGLFDENDNLVTLEGTKAIKSIKVSDGKLPTYSSVTFKGVDFGTYSVYETTKDGTPVTKDAQGIAVINGNKYTITGDSKGNATVSKTVPKKSITITNTYKPLTVTLKATKVLEDSRQMQTFSFMLRGNNVKDKQSNDSNGKIEFSTLTFTRKDVGTHTYTVKEVIPSGVDDNNFKDGVIYDTKEYQVVIEVTQNNEIGLTATVTVDGTKVEGTNGVYELPKQKGKASFINRYIPKTLTLSKKLYKNLGNMSQKFHFTLTLKLNGTTNPIPDGEYEVQSSVLSGATANSPNISTITFKNGVATVDLSHGQSITIKGLPNNYVIDSIVEDTTKGYEAIITAPDGAIINDTQQMIQLKDSNKIDESIEILYTNKYVEVPPEGVRNEVLPSVIAVVTGISVLGLLLLYRRKRRKRE
jgi:pilin isopeptide linkage protein